MPSQLIKNEGITFLACKPFTYRGVEYLMGDDFPQEEANNIETLIRSRFVIPVLEEGYLRPRHWHGHIRTREEAEEYLNRDRVQLVMPEPYHEPDSDEVVNLERLTYPHTTPSGEELADEQEAQQEEVAEEETTEEPTEEGTYDPGDYTVNEVLTHLNEVDDAEWERIIQAERDGRGRKGILED